MPWSMRTAINVHGTGTANSFPTIMIECNWVLAFTNEVFVQYIKHFQGRHFGRNIFNRVRLKTSFIIFILLPPNFQRKIHVVMFHRRECENVKMWKCENWVFALPYLL